jgi:hypothetical protein
MNSEKDEISKFGRLQKLLNLFQRVNQLSWTADQTRKRYPMPEAMTDDDWLRDIAKTLLIRKQPGRDVYFLQDAAIEVF